MSVCAAVPFDHAKADIILRSSDNIDFHVFKLFLSLASPFFETFFDVPQPAQASGNQEIKDGLVVIPVTEDGKTLDTLLRFCYPCTLTDTPSLRDTIAVLEAAKKYSFGVIETKARQALSNPTILEAEPLRCFAIAHQGRLREETILAAKYTLAQPLIPSWFKEIELISATDLLSLITYHKQCGDAVYALRLDLSWITSHYRNSEARKWLSGQWETCMVGRLPEETFAELQDKPCKATVQAHAEKTVQAVKGKKCRACSPMVTEGLRDFVELFAKKIEETVSQIELELKF